MNQKLKIEVKKMAFTPTFRERIEERIRPLLVGNWDDIDQVTVTIEKIQDSQVFCRIHVELTNGFSIKSEIISTDIIMALRSTSENVRFSTTDMLRSRKQK